MISPDLKAHYQKLPHVVIVGGGFAGLYAAKALGNQPVKVTLIDKRNFHLFQPLLYQVATGSLSPGDIASPLRSVLKQYDNITVLMNEVTNLDPDQNTITLNNRPEPLKYDKLVLATGGQTHYFGNDHWMDHTHGLKSIEDALNMRREVFTQFELAEEETDPEKIKKLLTFVIVGGGPTGVELAGALGELAQISLPADFKNVNCCDARILLVEMAPRILATFPEDLSDSAQKTLEKLGVTVKTQTAVTHIADGEISLKHNDETEVVQSATILWAAGVKASGLTKILSEKTGCQLDRGGRVQVEMDFSIQPNSNIYAVGDLASYSHNTHDGRPLPGVAPVAIQQGRFLAQSIVASLSGRPIKPFKYNNKGNMAVIGIKEAVADIPNFSKLSGWSAWLLWALVHVAFLVEFDNKVLVLFQWFWAILTRRHGARLITNKGVSY
ncbi:MAG: NAD(P)/FAD-dependent oxidoreductase [Cyanobacteria bacterium P01_H01_bin.74]